MTTRFHRCRLVQDLRLSSAGTFVNEIHENGHLKVLALRVALRVGRYVLVDETFTIVI